MSHDKIIEIHNASVYRGDTLVFDGFSLEIAMGQHTAILGPNGAGKTTFLKLLSRELYAVPAAGSQVRIFGQERWNVWELRNRLGIISNDLQHDYLGHVPGVEVVLSGLYSSIGTYTYQQFSRNDRARARDIMRDLDILALADKAFAAMSTGEQRRCLLGRALINDPETLVLDEPTSGLDLKATFHYLDLIRRLMRAGRTLILVTHHIHEIPPEVGRVVLIRDGTIVAQGAKSEILSDSRLSDLFDTRIKVLKGNGYYQAIPGGEPA